MAVVERLDEDVARVFTNQEVPPYLQTPPTLPEGFFEGHEVLVVEMRRQVNGAIAFTDNHSGSPSYAAIHSEHLFTLSYDGVYSTLEGEERKVALVQTPGITDTLQQVGFDVMREHGLDVAGKQITTIYGLGNEEKFSVHRTSYDSVTDDKLSFTKWEVGRNVPVGEPIEGQRQETKFIPLREAWFVTGVQHAGNAGKPSLGERFGRIFQRPRQGA